MCFNHKLWDDSLWAKRYLALIIRERPMKTAMRHHRHLFEWLLSERQELISVSKHVEQREPLGTVGRNVTCAATVENCMGIPQKGKNRASMRSSNSISGYFSEENENTKSEGYLHFMFVAAKI